MTRLWSAHAYKTPGEYGDKSLSHGFAIVTHPKLNGQIIYISSHSFVHGLMKTHRFTEDSMVSLLVTPQFKDSIPEVSLSADKGLAIFRERLEKLHQVTDKKKVLINCQRGKNRSPVAALIYMVDRGIAYDEAYDALMAGMRVRFPQFVLNPYQNYDLALQKLSGNLFLRDENEPMMTRSMTAHK